MRQECDENKSQKRPYDNNSKGLDPFFDEGCKEEIHDDVSLQSLYIYNLYNPQLVLLDCNVQLNPFGCYMISENAPRSTKGIWRKNILKDWFGLEGENKSSYGFDSQGMRFLTQSGSTKHFGNVFTNQDGSGGEKVQKYVYSGIKNLGATCYMGSYLQYLFMNLDFRSTFLRVDCSQIAGLRNMGGSQSSVGSLSRSGGARSMEGESSLSSMILPNIIDSNMSNDTEKEETGEKFSPPSPTPPPSSFDVIIELQKIFRQMETGRISVVNPIGFVKTLGISTENQEDATEFAVLLLSLLEAKLQSLSKLSNKEMSKSLNKDASKFIPDLFRGTLSYTIECVSCKNKTSIEDHFYELRLQLLINRMEEKGDSEDTNSIETGKKESDSVNVQGSAEDGEEKIRQRSREKDFNQKKVFSGYSMNSTLKLEHAFDNFFKQELLTDENQYMCEKCQHKTDAIKRCLIDRLPPYLHVCLQRYCYDSISRARKKVSVPVDFPHILNLKEYYSGEHKSKTESANNDPQDEQFYEYEFIGILEHQGQSAMSGHYTASLKDFQYLSDIEASNRDAPLKLAEPKLEVLEPKTLLTPNLVEEAVVVKKKRGRKPNSLKKLEALPAKPQGEDSKRSKPESEAFSASPSLDLINRYRIAQLIIQQQQQQQQQ
ncbi:Ubiquitin-specific peptidase, partial [Cryptosporidium hominis]